MIGAQVETGRWGGAIVLSLAVHATGMWLVFGQPFPAKPDVPIDTPQLQITTLAPPASDAAMPEVELLTSVVEPERPAEVSAPEIAMLGAEAEEVLISSPDAGGVAVPLPPAAADPAEVEIPQIAVDGEAPPLDPQLAELFDRIRAQLTQPCQLALPSMRADQTVQLDMLSPDDRGIAGLVADLTAGLDLQVAHNAVPVDQRQCPALVFARRDKGYPAFGLPLQLEAQTVPGGESLRGKIGNTAGYYNTLLLIDDAGVVHDLRRFLIASVGQVGFDVPLARVGAARDTYQLVVAIATPARPDSVGRMAGRLANDFFAALTDEIGDNALIGLGAVYVQ